MTQAEIQQFVYDFFYDKGLKHNSICAIMGNITGESSWNVDAIEQGNNIGFGLCQWSFSRRTQLENYGTTLKHQCEFLWSELTGENLSVTGADFQWISDPDNSVDNGEGFYCSLNDFLSGNNTPQFLTKAFCYCWERPAYATNHLDSMRIPSTLEFYYSMTYKGTGSGGAINSEEVRKINGAVEWAIAIANDDKHGYSQENRWGLDYDCSSLLIEAWETGGGVPVKTNGATYTGDMYQVFTANGFNDVTSIINLATGEGLKRGDILLNTLHHTEMMINSTQTVGAHSNYDGVTGDSSGNEIDIGDYYNYPWDYVLRYGSGWSDIPTNKKRKGLSKLLFFAMVTDRF